MSQAFYKTSAPEVMEALKQRNDQVEQLRAKGEAFAAHFGGKLIVRNGISGYSIAGLVFEPAKPSRLWTVPDRKSMGQQRPRASIVKATPEEKAELARIKAEWAEHFPKGDAPFEPVLNAMGTSYGALLFGGGFALRQTDSTVYVATSAKLNGLMGEILASEYEAGRKRGEAEDAAAESSRQAAQTEANAA
jgi:hypothetical protein